jgi:hypothetical protein
MRAVWKVTIVAGAATLIGYTIALLAQRSEVRNLTAVVLADDADIRKQHPVANVRVEAPGYPAAVTNASGLFQLQLPVSLLLRPLRTNRVSLNLAHPDYVTLSRTVALDGQLYVLRMKPVAGGASANGKTAAITEIPIADIRVRYTESARTSTDTGSVLKSFDVVNRGNVPCLGHQPCSPDGKWKAAMGGASLDAGEFNEFREGRVTCIAGPCPFTRIESDGFSRSARNISVSVRNWSDTVSFVLEAEVTRTTMSDLIRISYPFVFGRGLNFSLPPSGEGPSIEASVGDEDTVYPLGPDLTLSWATCSLQTARDRTKSYRCDLKSGYRFR